MKPLNEFEDNDEVAYEVRIGQVTDITAPKSTKQRVTKREVREMFVRFILSSPELLDKPRDEQIREFNLARHDAKRQKVNPELLADIALPAE